MLKPNPTSGGRMGLLCCCFLGRTYSEGLTAVEVGGLWLLHHAGDSVLDDNHPFHTSLKPDFFFLTYLPDLASVSPSYAKAHAVSTATHRLPFHCVLFWTNKEITAETLSILLQPHGTACKTALADVVADPQQRN